MFVDEVDIQVAAGDGGRGCVSFRREKFVPRGGPNGGDGGHGGSVYLVASPHLNTLVNFRFHPEFNARRGAHGEGSNRTGHDGADLVLDVPVGTVVYRTPPDGGTPMPVADLAHEGAARARGARRPRRTRQRALRDVHQPRAPARPSPGEPGESVAPAARAQAARRRRPGRLPQRRQVDAHLAHLGRAAEDRRLPVHHADAATSASCGLGDDRSFVVADVPGLIEGAHRGHGPGPPVPAPPRADEGARARRRRVVGVGPRSGATTSTSSAASWTCSTRRLLRSAAARGGQQDRRARRPGAARAAAARRPRRCGLPVFRRLRRDRARACQELLEAIWQRVAARGGPLAAARPARTDDRTPGVRRE